jgi:1-phosphatidylinositol phosphodiesterase
MADLNEWMSDIPDDTKLSNIIMPGSHDAGMSVVQGKRAVGFGWAVPDASIITQDLDIAGQLNAGTRFFDIRVYNWGKIHGELYTGHFAEAKKGKATAGGYGQKLDEVLTQVKGFLDTNDSETVILKFSHMTHTNAKKVMEKVNTDCKGYLYGRERSDSIPKRPMEKFRKKIIAMYDKSLPYDDADKSKKAHSFKSYKPGTKPNSPKVDTVEEEKRLILWGEYSNTKKFDNMYADQKKKIEFRKKQWFTARNVPHLYQLYWTMTGGNVKENTKIASAKFKDKWRWLAKGPPGHALCPNIVVYDFANEEQNQLIVEVNEEKPRW